MSSPTKVVRGEQAANAKGALAAHLATFDQHKSHRHLTASQAADLARKNAIEKGYSDGLEAARRDVESATEEANKRVRRALAALCEAVEGFDQRQTLALAEIEDQVIAIAFEIAKSILQCEITTATNPGAQALARAMRLAPNRGDVIARLNPKDVETLSIDHVSTTTQTVQVVPDSSIEPGGCVVEVGDTRIDSQISSVLQRIAETLGVNTFAALDQAVAGRSPNNSGMTVGELPL